MALDSFIAETVQIWARLDIFGLVIPLLTYAFLLAIYAAFVWHFYKSIAKRDLVKLNFHDGSELKDAAFYVIKYLVTFPVLTFLWFAGLSIVLFLLSKSQSTQTVLLLSMGVVAAARVCSYYRHEAAEELAKILPLGVLAIFLVDPAYFSWAITLGRFYELPSLVPLLVNYLFFTVVLEFSLRILYLLKQAFFDGHKKEAKPKKKRK